jgi:hypothetical protein
MNDQKENFCTACLTVPLAIAGSGMSIYGTNSTGKQKKTKKILLISGIITLLFVAYLIFRKKSCSSGSCSI